MAVETVTTGTLVKDPGPLTLVVCSNTASVPPAPTRRSAAAS